ncbi:hypothetical protein C5750_15045 [Phyllobacterium myrsinacearum]|uniref:Uncharacterized protein n=1 Tax=Phyllobacterium myrsinacearum TaxID=28101 RepID=A0A2S9JI10_9HYPH|nr:hypothetical protein C5750_15045 [Phyllobacterium myrsinacearum]
MVCLEDGQTFQSLKRHMNWPEKTTVK